MSLSKLIKYKFILVKMLRARGVWGAMGAAIRFIIQAKSKSLPVCRDLIEGQHGLEIGGPSPGFGPNGFLPIYPLVGKLDNCNFSCNTVWEGPIEQGIFFQFDPHKPVGRQFVAEATDLNMIPDDAYDFIVSCHALEHTANPLRALLEWQRVLKTNGGIVLVVPHKEDTFDCRRPVTTLQHLIEDYRNKTGEDDSTHIPEILKLTDVDRDWGIAGIDELTQRAGKNLQNRCVHHHVFKTSLVVQLFDFVGMQVLSAESIRPFHAIVCARKLPKDQSCDNEPFLKPEALWRKNSPFKIDRE